MPVPDRQTLTHLLNTLTPELVEGDNFTSSNTHPQGPRLYGGQVLAQTLRAAVLTVASDRRVHSQHAYFLRPGDPSVPVELEVERARDGGSFSSRRVVAHQHGRPILVSSLSFHKPEESDEYALDMPTVPGPEGLQNERARELANGEINPQFMIVTGSDLDVRVVNPVDWVNPVARKPVLQAWMKTTAPVTDEPGLHESLLAYMSDAFLIDVALITHGKHYSEGMQCASLDHAIWFHAPCRADEWLLHITEAQRLGSGRGLSHGRFYNSAGVLVATCMQESLMRQL
jgi:acyl-CoA thioesterase-2